jgi:hypothetical protein
MPQSKRSTNYCPTKEQLVFDQQQEFEARILEFLPTRQEFRTPFPLPELLGGRRRWEMGCPFVTQFFPHNIGRVTDTTFLDEFSCHNGKHVVVGVHRMIGVIATFPGL